MMLVVETAAHFNNMHQLQALPPPVGYLRYRHGAAASVLLGLQALPLLKKGSYRRRQIGSRLLKI